MNAHDSMATRLQRWQQGEQPGPWRMTVLPAVHCNLRCAICWQRAIEPRKDREVSEERLLTLADEAAALGVREWDISGGGEPLMRADTVMALCGRIRSHGMNGVIQTNGTLMKEEHLRHLVDIGWERIVFSIDGPTAEVTDAIRSRGAFDKATAAVRLLTAFKKERGAALPGATFHSVITRTNYERLSEMAALAHALGCDTFETTSLIEVNETCRDLRLGAQELADLPGCAQTAITRADALGLRHNLSALAGSDAPATGVASSPRERGEGLLGAICFEPWLGLTVHSDGAAGPCCLIWEPECPSVHDHSLAEVWTGPYFESFRQRLIAGNVHPACAGCLSTLRQRSETLRAELQWRGMSPLQRWASLARKSLSSLRRHGLRKALQRGKEWRMLRK